MTIVVSVLNQDNVVWGKFVLSNQSLIFILNAMLL